MREQAWIWRCELCGHGWLASGLSAPEKCAKCKRRGWHTKAAIAQSAERLPHKPQDAGSTPDGQTSIDDLRAICAGQFPSEPISAALALPMCSYTEYDTDTGETYACGLRVHSYKVKHTRGAVIS